ncbi:hypothetical protein GGF32_006759 [Allomyces javanicus]|nr:hypothetical protein GGF32_006759 [Allomyces javanicus]
MAHTQVRGLYEDDEDDKDSVSGQDSDDDIDYDSNLADEDQDGDMSDDASDFSDTSNDADPGVSARAPKDVLVPEIDAIVLAQIAKNDYGKLMCGATAKFDITQSRRDTVPPQDLDHVLGPTSTLEHIQLAATGIGTARSGAWDAALMARVGVTMEYARFCIACGHAPYSARTAYCDDWSRQPTSADCGLVVFGVRRRR